jgi:hypothetical protein
LELQANLFYEINFLPDESKNFLKVAKGFTNPADSLTGSHNPLTSDFNALPLGDLHHEL